MEIKVLNKKCNDFPTLLKELKDCPEELYCMGNIELLNKPSIAIVGTRNIDEYGISQTKRFSSILSQKGLTIVSGLARGVDSYAHFNSMKNEGKTIAVIASGFNHIYPPENIGLFNEILENDGLIISEWEPDKEVDMRMFPRRNRIISGLSVGTLVIEAKFRSGSGITARLANDQNREVFCIPGDIDNIRSVRTNLLIMNGANLVTSPYDILDTLEYDNLFEKNNKEIKLDEEYEEIIDKIGDTPINANRIARIIEKPISYVNERLTILELDGFIKSDNRGNYNRVNEGNA